MTDRELFEKALEALEYAAERIGCPDDDDAIGVARKALRERLAQPERTHWEGCEEVHPECKKPEQEPVAWIQPNHLQKAMQAPFLCRVEPNKRMADFVGIYTAPPQRKPPQFPTMLRKMWSGAEVQKWINENWEQS